MSGWGRPGPRPGALRLRRRALKYEASVADTRLGVQAPGGVKEFLFRPLAVFAEHKFSSTDASLRYGAFGGRTRSTTFDSPVSSHHLSGGLALRLDLF